jgi:capsular exopolysaccharide synthesis family protein
MTDRASEASPPPTEDGIDLHSLFVRFLRRLPIFLAVAFVIMAAVAAYTFTATPRYTSTASIAITPQGADVLQQAQTPVGISADSSTIETQVQVLESRPIARRVVQRLNLTRDPEFNPMLGEKKKGIREWLEAARPKTAAAERAPGPEVAMDIATDIVQGVTSSRRNGLTYVVEISATSIDGEKAALLANTLAEEYISAGIEAKYNLVRGDSSFIGERLSALAREVVANEAAVQQYKIANNLMSAQGATMAEQELSVLNQQIAAAQADLSEKVARLQAARDQMRRGGGGGDVAAALGSTVVQQLRAQRADISRRQAELQTRYGPLHPDVKKVERELADNDAQIQEEIGRILSNLEAEVAVSQQRLSSLNSSRGRAQGALGSNNAAVVTLNELQRRADASRAVYEAFLNRSKENSAQEGLQRADARITSPAQEAGEPTSPNKKLNLALGFVLAVAAGFGAVLLMENLDGALLTSRDVEQKLLMPSIGAIPLLTRTGKAPKDTYVLSKPFSGFAEAFRNLKTSLTLSRDDREIKIVTVSSALPGEGKTLTTVSFGRSLAQAGSRVLVIDADLRRRQLTQAFRVPVDVGLVEVLQGKAQLEEAIGLDEASGAHLLLLSNAPAPTVDLFSTSALDELFQRLRNEYDFIVIDTAPVLAVAETRTIAARADATVFLVRWSKTPKQAAGAALDLLLSSGAFVAGVCLTQVDMSKQTRLGYGDKLYYYQGYRKYYQD